jgi:hypothetical protein
MHSQRLLIYQANAFHHANLCLPDLIRIVAIPHELILERIYHILSVFKLLEHRLIEILTFMYFNVPTPRDLPCLIGIFQYVIVVRCTLDY